jgi:hypothetical protein
MDCPICREKMKEILPAQVQLNPLQQEEEVYPSKIICALYHIYSCDMCNIKASKPEFKEYIACDCKTVKGNE